MKRRENKKTYEYEKETCSKVVKKWLYKYHFYLTYMSQISTTFTFSNSHSHDRFEKCFTPSKTKLKYQYSLGSN